MAGLRYDLGYEMMIETIPRRVAELDEPALQIDQAVRVAGARVVWSDDALLRADFPWLPADGELAGWLLRHAAVVSATQAAQTLANTPIATQGPPAPAYRLPRGGRAFFVTVSDETQRAGETSPGAEGLLALKGVGVAPGVTPTNDVKGYGNGLLPLHEILKESLNQKLIETILHHARQEVRALPVYAVLDLGFDICGAAGERWPAGVLVRRAHRRPPKGWDLPLRGSRDQALCLDIELLLRRYGVTSATEGTTQRLTRDPGGTFVLYYYHRGKMQRGRCPQAPARALWDTYAPPGDSIDLFVCFEGINIQMTRSERPEDAELIDFGAYNVRETFAWPLLSMVQNHLSNWGGLIPPRSPHYVQPDPRLSLPARYWQEGARLDERELRDLCNTLAADEDDATAEAEGLCPVDQLCFRLSRAVRAGRLSGAAVQQELATLVARLTAHWPLAPPTDTAWQPRPSDRPENDDPRGLTIEP